MNHPSREDLGLYVFGEAPPETHKQIKAHLNECHACAQEITSMRGTLRRLDSWEIPRSRERRAMPEPVLKLAMAAAIVLALGVGIGRWSAQSSAAKLEAQIAAASAAEAEARSALLAESEQRLSMQTAQAMRALATEIFEAVNTGREEDRAAVREAISRLQQQRDTDYVALRRDIETVASATDAEIRDAQLKLLQLAVNSTPTP